MEFSLPNKEQFDEIINQMKIANNTTAPDDHTNAPGGKVLLSGDRNCGFYGFVQPHEIGLIDDVVEPNNVFNGENLALAIGLSIGVPVYSNVPWMKFSWNGKILLIPMRVIRTNISWDRLYLTGAVYGSGEDISPGEQYMLDNDKRFLEAYERTPQNAQVKVSGLDYKVRLMRGSANTPNKYDDPGRGGPGPENEWNNLILPLHEQAPNNFTYNTHAGAPTEDWDINLTDDDLRTHYTLGAGSYSWMQEVSDLIADSDIPEEGTIRRVGRGGYGASVLYAVSSRNSSTNYGWRPVLELL